jgi:hypothetical protein
MADGLFGPVASHFRPTDAKGTESPYLNSGGPAPVRAYNEELLPDILGGTPGPHDP